MREACQGGMSLELGVAGAGGWAHERAGAKAVRVTSKSGADTDGPKGEEMTLQSQ